MTKPEDTARYASLLLAPAEGFGRGFFCPSGKKRAYYTVLAHFWHFLVSSNNLGNFSSKISNNNKKTTKSKKNRKISKDIKKSQNLKNVQKSKKIKKKIQKSKKKQKKNERDKRTNEWTDERKSSGLILDCFFSVYLYILSLPAESISQNVLVCVCGSTLVPSRAEDLPDSHSLSHTCLFHSISNNNPMPKVRASRQGQSLF